MFKGSYLKAWELLNRFLKRYFKIDKHLARLLCTTLSDFLALLHFYAVN